MNVIVANKQQDILSNLDIDIIKNINGEFTATEIVDMFKNFFYNRMILDVSSIRDYEDLRNFQILSDGLDSDKIIFFLPQGSIVCTPNFLSKLVSMGIYNFTTNIDGVKFLINKPNTYKDVAALQNVSSSTINHSNDNISNETGATIISKNISNNAMSCKIVGFVNATINAGSTSLIYMIKNELSKSYGDKIIAVEVNKHDFQYFNDNSLISIDSNNLLSTVKKNLDKSIILIDLNDCKDDSICSEVIYLMEPSIIKVNRLVKNNRQYLNKLVNKKVVLNKCLLSKHDISEFEMESGIKFYYDIPPLNDRVKNDILIDFCEKINLLQETGSNNTNNGIFGRFKR